MASLIHASTAWTLWHNVDNGVWTTWEPGLLPHNSCKWASSSRKSSILYKNGHGVHSSWLDCQARPSGHPERSQKYKRDTRHEGGNLCQAVFAGKYVVANGHRNRHGWRNNLWSRKPFWLFRKVGHIWLLIFHGLRLQYSAFDIHACNELAASFGELRGF